MQHYATILLYYIMLKTTQNIFTLSRAVFFDCPHSVNLEPWPLMHACTIPEAVLYTNCSLKSPVPFLFLSSLFPSVPPSRPCFCYYLCWSSHGVFYDFLLLLFFVITLPTWNFKPWHNSQKPANSSNPATGGPRAPQDGGRKGGGLRFGLSSFTPHSEHPSCILHR